MADLRKLRQQADAAIGLKATLSALWNADAIDSADCDEMIRDANILVGGVADAVRKLFGENEYIDNMTSFNVVWTFSTMCNDMKLDVVRGDGKDELARNLTEWRRINQV